MARIGLVAGYGGLPVVFSKIAKEKGDSVVAFGLRGVTDEELSKYVEKVHWLEWGAFHKALLLLAAERLKKIIMLGKIRKDIFFKGDEKLDDKAKELLAKVRDRKDYSILNEVTKVLAKFGVEVVDPIEYLKGLIPSKGVFTKRNPTESEWRDINYGMDVAREIARLDIGQTVVVKDKTVIALEAVEGTDETISRAGTLCKDGFTVVKSARPNQDMRLDVPLVGLKTLDRIIESNGRVLALEAGKTFLMDKEEMIKLADEKDISVVVV